MYRFPSRLYRRNGRAARLDKSPHLGSTCGMTRRTRLFIFLFCLIGPLWLTACALLPGRQPDVRCPIVNFAKWDLVRDSEALHPSFAPPGRESLHGLSSEADEAAYLAALEKWRELAAGLEKAGPRAQAEAVNVFFNAWEYTSDKKAWGQEEYWATPREFMARSGDCEDYAIAKYYALRSLGFAPEKLRLAGAWNRRRGEAHAVLLVYVNGQSEAPLLLDNYSDKLRRLEELPHYQMQYYVNEEYLWLMRGLPLSQP